MGGVEAREIVKNRHMLDRLDLILLMTVNPGFGGQAFIPSVVDKVRRVKALIGNRPIDIEIDGGITPETAPLVCAAGANVLVAGSAVFKGGTRESYAANISAIRAAACASPRAARAAASPLRASSTPAASIVARVAPAATASPGWASNVRMRPWVRGLTCATRRSSNATMPGTRRACGCRGRSPRPSRCRGPAGRPGRA